jgi:hypothetical protein
MRREEEPGGRERESSGVDIGERSPLFSSKVVECVSNKEVVTVSRHIIEVSQYRTFSIFFTIFCFPSTSSVIQSFSSNCLDGLV